MQLVLLIFIVSCRCHALQIVSILGKPIRPTNQKKKAVECGRTVQNVSPAMNAVVSKPVTPLRQGSPSVFHFQPRPVLQNGQAAFAIVPSSNQNQQVYLAQPSVSILNGPVPQFNSVSSVAPEPVTLRGQYHLRFFKLCP